MNKPQNPPDDVVKEFQEELDDEAGRWVEAVFNILKDKKRSDTERDKTPE
jgi:hypothetical protein